MFVRSLHPERLLRALHDTPPFLDYCKLRDIRFVQAAADSSEMPVDETPEDAAATDEAAADGSVTAEGLSMTAEGLSMTAEEMPNDMVTTADSTEMPVDQLPEDATAPDEDAAVTAEELLGEMLTTTDSVEMPADEAPAEAVDVPATQAETSPAAEAPAEEVAATAVLGETTGEPTPDAAPAKKPRRKKTADADGEPKEKKLGAVDAAAKVLGETGQPMTCQELIDAMAAKGYWKSPGARPLERPSIRLFCARSAARDPTPGSRASGAASSR
jgi:hypothetical protein